jgi:hypothetical protein
MKRCIKCGCEIVNGVNGCTLMQDCFKCHGGFPVYPVPVVKDCPYGPDYLEYAEGRCLDMAKMPD